MVVPVGLRQTGERREGAGALRGTLENVGSGLRDDMLVILLRGVDIVLGIHWLITLGDIRWNFSQLKMEFHMGTKKIYLRGSQPGSLKVIADVKMQKILNKPGQINLMSMDFVQTIKEDEGQKLEAKMPEEVQTLQFVKNYGMLARPLTELLKKDKLEWSDYVTAVFKALKLAISTTPVLALPDFLKEFVVEMDASGCRIGAVLMQDSHPLAYMSKSLSDAYLSLPVYKKRCLQL
ncbi:uncharacterized protein LOC124888793 [Capsicum annuum]|uniref:uncharacterized protein LOC124888793 n=1 Tax=Capsicum annuum TaxID=4072 RepID=UPI001FB091AD|nr:uncharacterized protein LOC124888793 [Capsicum annuum]